MSKGGRVNQQQGYQDPSYGGSGQPYNNQPQPVGYVPPGAGSTISTEPVQPNYNAPQQGFSSSPGKGVRPSPYGGGFGGGFGGYQPPPYGGGFGSFQQPSFGGGFGGGFGSSQQPSYGRGFGGPTYAQGYGMQGGIGSLLPNYSSYTPPRMPFNPYASDPYLPSGAGSFNSSPGKGMRPQPYGGGFGGYQQPSFGGGFSGSQEPNYGGGFVDMPSPQPINQPSLLADPKEAFLTSQPSTEPSEPSFFDMFPDAPPPPRVETQDIAMWINPITGQQDGGGSSRRNYQNHLKEYLDSNPEAATSYSKYSSDKEAKEAARRENYGSRNFGGLGESIKNAKPGILRSTLRRRY